MGVQDRGTTLLHHPGGFKHCKFSCKIIYYTKKRPDFDIYRHRFAGSRSLFSRSIIKRGLGLYGCCNIAMLVDCLWGWFFRGHPQPHTTESHITDNIFQTKDSHGGFYNRIPFVPPKPAACELRHLHTLFLPLNAQMSYRKCTPDNLSGMFELEIVFILRIIPSPSEVFVVTEIK